MKPRIEEFLLRLRPLSTDVNRAWWDAAVSGSESDYRRLEELRNQVDSLFW